ncbi:NAD(+) synthase [Mobilicoccus sp.]|uniref:NAD(+) synthase n=1 Tax=Mobilicoccus sp. TaxID=2034349 RepID=UPI00289C53A1|nr:NAD(+) synthase [Mobilicoccus sp.]
MTVTGEVEARAEWIADQVHALGKRGALVQLSGGIDSTVVVHLCARALGPENVTALYLPDAASTGEETRGFVDAAVASAGVRLVERPIGAAIEASQPISEMTEIIRRYAPEYDPDRDAYAVNAVPSMAKRLGTLVYRLSIGPRHGAPTRTLSTSVEDLRAVIAYQNRKQRTRMTFAYAEAEKANLAVVGASNGDELDTGFVVKYGDDAADICAIGDLPKTEVYAFARELGVPEEIIARPPTTDTYALAQTQEDYYYALPADLLRRLTLAADADGIDALDVTPFLAEVPGWSENALRQVATGLLATLRYQRTRSLRPGHEGEAGRDTGL